MLNLRSRIVPLLCACAITSVVQGEPLFPAGTTTMNIAFDGAADAKGAVVRPPAAFTKENGFGFSTTSTVTGNAKGVEADKFMRFDVNVPEGNYDVMVMVGNPTKDATTTIRSEEHRPQAVDVHTKAGEYLPVKFTVNVHVDVANHTELNSDGAMHLEFIGENPSFTAIDIKPNTTAPTIYVVGDSTACDYDKDPRVGWGQMFPLFFKPGEVAVCNMAKSGRTAKSFINEKRLDDLWRTIKPGDYMLVQFAHNDQKDTSLTPAAWKEVLMKYIDGARQRKAFPMLVTSMPRRQFDANNKIVNSLGDFPQTMRDLAKEQTIPLIDLNAKATEFFDILGPDGTLKAFCHYPGGVYEGHPNANLDNTHFHPYGAYELAKIVAREIQNNKLGPAAWVADPLEAQNTDPAKFPKSLDYNPLLIQK